jgi:hypothetical protein
MKPRYRIVVGSVGGYRVEIWRWCWPFWTSVGSWYVSVGAAEDYVRQHARHVVKYVPYPEAPKVEP